MMNSQKTSTRLLCDASLLSHREIESVHRFDMDGRAWQRGAAALPRLRVDPSVGGPILSSAFRRAFGSLWILGLVVTLGPGARGDEPEAKITFDDHVRPIFREHCLACHHSGDKSGGLALDTYSATMEGGGGGKVIEGGSVDGSRLWSIINHTAQPFMPPDSDKIPQEQLDIIRAWIDQGILENSGSTAKKKKVNAALTATVQLGRPEGDPPMPEFYRKQPVVVSERSAAIAALAASPWAPVVAIGGQKQVSLYHTVDRKLLGILPFPEGEPQSIRFSQDGSLVLVAGGRHSHSGMAVLYDLKTGERIAKIGDELDIVFSADLSEDRRKVVLGGPSKMVRVYDTGTGNLLYEQKKHTDWIYAVRFSPDGALLASADRSNGLILWEADTGRLYLDLVGHKGEIRSVTWSPDSSALVSSSMDGTIKMWELNEGRLIKSVDAHGGGVASVEVCNDGTFVSTGMDNKLKIWDANLNLIGEAAIPDSGLEAAISVDGRQVFAGDWSGNVTGWNRDSLDQPFALKANPASLEFKQAMALQSVQEAKSQLLEAATRLAEVQVQLESRRASIAQAESEEQKNVIESAIQALLAQQSEQLALQVQAALELKARQQLLAEADGDLAVFYSYRDALVARVENLNHRTAELETRQVQLKEGIEAAVASTEAIRSETETLRSEIARLQNLLAASEAKLGESDRISQELRRELEQVASELESIQSESATAFENRDAFLRAYGPQ